MICRLALVILLVAACAPPTGRQAAGEERAPSGDTPSAEAADSGFVARTGLPTYTELPTVEDLIFELTNEARIERGIPALRAEPTLGAIAREHNADMLARDFFDHVDPDGVSASDRVAHGHRRLIGTAAENIWYGEGYPAGDPSERRALAELVMSGWMASRGHRESILDPELTHLGVGVTMDGRRSRATQVFASIHGYTDAPVPLQLERGATFEVGVTPASGRPVPDRSELWVPENDTRHSLAEGTVDAPPGSYRLRFYFPESTDLLERTRRWTLVPGPSVTVR